MKSIILLRHAKATKSMFNIDDIDRPLVEKGISDAAVMALWLKKNKHLPDIIISSSAVRAYSTALVIARILEYPMNKIKINKSLYECGVDGYQDVISSIKDEHKTVLLCAHNPDITDFAMDYCSQFNHDMPTAAVAGINFKVAHWEELSNTKGSFGFYEYPR